MIIKDKIMNLRNKIYENLLHSEKTDTYYNKNYSIKFKKSQSTLSRETMQIIIIITKIMYTNHS